MELSRNAYLAGVVLGGALLSSAPALAQADFPNRPVRVVVGFAAGGPADISARVIGNKTGEILKQQFVIENKPGAAGMIAAEMVARSAPDGYTLLNTPISYAVNETLSKTLRAEIGKDIVAVAPQAQTANVLVVHPSLGVKTVAEFVEHARKNPGKVFYGTSGRGASSHLNTEQFNLAAGIKTMPVHYRGGGESTADLLKGEIKFIFATIAPVRELIRDGKLIGLATTGPTRDPALPDLPTIAESGYPGFDFRFWQGLTAPAQTPPAVIKKLQEANAKALEDPDVVKSLEKLGFSTMKGTTEDFDKFYRAERDKWAKVVRETGMDKD